MKRLNTSLPIQPSSHGATRQWARLKLIIAKHEAYHITKLSPDSRKENMLSLLTGLGKGYCCILLPQPEGKVISSQIAFCVHKMGISNGVTS